jgi:threonine dehydrogenase-like Zn-dependent dehydrogenase
MADNRFSNRLPKVNVAEYPPAIQKANKELVDRFGSVGVTWCRWNDDWVAAAITVPVDLPFRGPVNGIDIRPEEPLLLVFPKVHYPYRVPMVRADRLDFPSNRLPHLNPARPGEPPSLCLHRGSIDDWFAEHGLLDLVRRAQGWLRDAAANRLIREDDRFEETRIEAPGGVVESDAEDLEAHVSRYWAANNGQGGHAVCLLKRTTGPESPWLEWMYFLTPENQGRTLSIVREYNEAAVGANLKSRFLLGLLVWPRKADACAEYFANLPTTYAELIRLAGSAYCDLERAMAVYEAQQLDVFEQVPVVLVVRRPKPLIRSGRDIEILHFLASRESALQHLSSAPTCSVSVLQHRFPLTVAKARELSKTPGQGLPRILIAGCGAVGSKVGLSLARGGYTDLVLVDDDTVSTHNMVRNALLPDQVGQNKAQALKDQISAMYSGDKRVASIGVHPVTLQDRLFGNDAKQLSSIQYLLDCSASRQVMHALTDSRIPPTLRTIRCELTDQGQLGLWLLEGAGRNPRVDDLQALLWDSAVENDAISGWLGRHRQRAESTSGLDMEEIGIGMGCSTSTMRLPDDLISYHAACFTVAAKQAFHSADHAGRIQVTALPKAGLLATHPQTLAVGRTEIVRERNKGWTVRVSRRAFSYLKEQLRATSPNETGGILLGMCIPVARLCMLPVPSLLRLTASPVPMPSCVVWRIYPTQCG